MIGKITGRVDEVAEDFAIIDVGGVGYVVHCTGGTLSRLPPRGEHVSLVIETHVREDMIRLFGFSTTAERDWFRLLQTVQGVGAKVALAVLSALAPQDLARAVALGDAKTIARTQGIGPKLANRIVSELKDKASVIASVPGDAFIAAGRRAPAGAVGEAMSALINLGYSQLRAADAVSSAVGAHGQDAPLEILIRSGLKELAR